MRRANKDAFTSRRYRELMQNNRFECYKHVDNAPAEDVAISPHHHAFYEIIFVLEGDLFYEVEGRPYHLTKGDVILIDELQFHGGVILNTMRYERYAIWIHPKYMQLLSRRFPKLDPQYCFLQLNSDNNNLVHLNDEEFAEITHDLKQLFESYWSKTPSDEVLSESYCAIILTKLNQIVHRMHQEEGESNLLTHDEMAANAEEANANSFGGQILSSFDKQSESPFATKRASTSSRLPGTSREAAHGIVRDGNNVTRTIVREETVVEATHEEKELHAAREHAKEVADAAVAATAAKIELTKDYGTDFNAPLKVAMDAATDYTTRLGDRALSIDEKTMQEGVILNKKIEDHPGTFVGSNLNVHATTSDPSARKRPLDSPGHDEMAVENKTPFENTEADLPRNYYTISGDSPAPLVKRDEANVNIAYKVDEDAMHLNLKLSERLKLSALLNYINNNINDTLSLDELSERFNLSKFYLTRRFKELTGLSLHQFIVKKRLTKARYLISVGVDPYRAAVDAGFNNYSHFSRTFKSYFGQNPSTIPQAQKIHKKDVSHDTETHE